MANLLSKELFSLSILYTASLESYCNKTVLKSTFLDQKQGSMHSSNASQTHIFSSQLVKSNRPGHKEPLEKKPLRESPRGNVLQILQSKGIINIALILCGWIPTEEICEINTDYTKHTFLKKWMERTRNVAEITKK